MIDPGFGIETASLTASWVEALPERQTVGRHVARGRHAMSMSASSSIRSACGSARTTCFAWRRSKAPCRNAPCAASPRLNPPKGLDWPKNLPRPARLFVQPGKGRSRRRTARSSAAALHLAQHPPPRRQSRWAGAHSRRMVGERQRNATDPRLLPRRDDGRLALLAVSRRAGRARRQLVAAWRG